jgi:cytosine/adenosine deaminase-related metal-dependent hydrolase
MTRKPPLLTSVLLLVLFVQAPALSQTGKFTLHKFEQAIGEESYTISHEGDALRMQVDFAFTDRGTKVPLKASFEGTDDYTPRSFTIKGSTSRFSTIDDEIRVSGASAQVREEKRSQQVSTPAKFFTIAGYAPASLQMLLIRYWRARGMPARLPVLPSGEVEIADRGPDSITVQGHAIALERYSIKGLVWGIETLWSDSAGDLAALVTRDAEFDHFEAVREQYESALATFVSKAASDQMTELEDLGRHLSGRQTGDFAFVGATLIDGTGKPTVQDAVVVTRGNKIVAAGPAASISIPANVTRIDAHGKYIIPGLWDMHAHYEQVEWGPIYLAAGVTTVRDVGNEFEFITAVRDKLNSGQGLGPHMLLAGVVDGDGPFALGIDRVNSPADAARWVKTYKDAGFQQMKIYSSMKPENVKAVCQDAHAVGMTVTGHIPIGMDVYDGVNDGMDQVNHISYIAAPLLPKGQNGKPLTREERRQAMMHIDIHSPAGEKLVEFLEQHGTVVDDTLALFEENLHPESEPFSKWEPGAAKVAPELREQILNGGSPITEAEFDSQMKPLLEIISALHRAGVPLVAGTDQAVPGYSVYREIELYVKAGFTPMEALQAATIVPARVMKVDSETGTVEAGKRADFDILDANPLENIHNIRSVRQVVANGVLYQSAPLWQTAGFQP